jgi:L-asparaginase/Glu-tRNA(Gln) amidotransferase subunit D
MRMVSNSDYDGKANLVNSIKQVRDPDCLKYASGVTVNFAGKIHSPLYIQKEHSFALGIIFIPLNLIVINS